jgi:hypothetical protein
MRIAVAIVVGLLLGSDARADERRWYGWQALIVDGATTGLVVAAAVEEEVELVGEGLLLNAIGAPIVHGVHGNWGRAGISLALRLSLGFVAVMSVAEAADCHDLCDEHGAIYGLAPYFIAAGVDAAIGWERRPARASPAPPLTPPSLTPVAIAKPGGVVLGLGGTF